MVVKLYTDKDYSRMAKEANKLQKKLIKVQEEVQVPYEVYEYEKIVPQVPIYNEEGEIIGYEYPENPDAIDESELVDDLTKPIMIDEPVIDPETGEPMVDPETGEVITTKVHKHHTEYRTEIQEHLEIVDNPGNFQRRFFETSLGYVSRTVHNLNGGTENFLNDTVPALKEGIPIITYNLDGSQNRDKVVTEEFLKECKDQKWKDFYGTTPPEKENSEDAE